MTPPNPTPPDDLDRLLSAYFRRQVPDPFPQCRALADLAEPSSLVAAREPVSPFANRSRLTMAASVAALFGLGLAVSTGVRSPHAAKAPPSPEGGDLLRNSTANGAELLKHTGK